ncbi:ammonium transporter [Hyphomicrobium sp. 99]|uniref:ammonium transporter n=1 Tax=Hyphomicrobium sp. 99 TaxID=1163419 RepID=UPI0009E45BC0|nr:ammonium transporter [Hyphomicrobium sp. 99]
MFAEQMKLDNLTFAFVYAVGAVSVLFVVIGLGLIDMGLVRARNVLDTWVQKFAAAIFAGFGTLFVGYAIWQYQFYIAFAVPDPLVQVFKDWWIGGGAASSMAIKLDPKVVPEADIQQIFLVFFVTFSMATAALIHSSVIERIKSLPLLVMSFLIGLVFSPLVGYLCWGPLSPLTNAGTHDFEGVFPLYIFSGTWALILSWRLGPRLGALSSHPDGLKPVPSNQALVALGVLFIFVAIPFVSIGSTWVLPDKAVYGISMTQTGLGLILINIFSAMLTGGVVGALIGRTRKDVSWVFLGPIAGVVISGTLFDIGTPLECMVFGGLGPIVAFATSRLVHALGLEEPKVVPLALGPGIVGAILVGFVHWGTPTGGFPGLEGAMAPGHATITPYWQLMGVLATVTVAAVPALILSFFFEMTTGLRVSAEAELNGLDAANWGASNFGDDLRGKSVPMAGRATAG